MFKFLVCAFLFSSFICANEAKVSDANLAKLIAEKDKTINLFKDIDEATKARFSEHHTFIVSTVEAIIDSSKNVSDEKLRKKLFNIARYFLKVWRARIKTLKNINFSLDEYQKRIDELSKKSNELKNDEKTYFDAIMKVTNDSVEKIKATEDGVLKEQLITQVLYYIETLEKFTKKKHEAKKEKHKNNEASKATPQKQKTLIKWKKTLKKTALLVFSKFKAFFVCFVCMIGLMFSIPTFLSKDTFLNLPSFMQYTINLGLELRGGSHLQLELDLKSVEKDYLNSLIDDVRSLLRKNNIGYIGLSLNNNSGDVHIKFELKDKTVFPFIKSALLKIDNELSIDLIDNFIKIRLSEEFLNKKNQSLIDQSIEVVRRRVDESGTKEPIIQKQGNDRIIVQLPGIDNPSDVKALIGKTAKMTLQSVDESAKIISAKSKSEAITQKAPNGSTYLPMTYHDGSIVFIAVKDQVMLSGDCLLDAQVSYDVNGQPCTSFKLNSFGVKKFGEMSKKGGILAIVLDNEVISAPRFKEPILNGQCQITGNFSLQEAHDLALLLRAGSLPVPLKVVEERTIGPSLGLDSIYHGQIATIIAFSLVCIFMVIVYKLFGIFSSISLFFNLSLLFAGLSILQATLTLPGIAGIALTIGMAVDANVLIYERIKEELRLGAKAVIAIEAGYKRALTTILDSNITTLIGAFVLFEFGTGPIRGFAVTLALGILISLFTALSLNRLLIALWIKNKRISKLSI